MPDNLNITEIILTIRLIRQKMEACRYTEAKKLIEYLDCKFGGPDE